MKNLSATFILFGAAIVFVVGLIGFAIFKGAAPSQYDSFAQCLTDKGTIMYGAWWCPHCQNQKNLFGTSFKKVTYVECSPNQTKTMSEQCKNDGIEGYPTWVFADGTKVSGEQTFDFLAEKSGCELPTTSSR